MPHDKLKAFLETNVEGYLFADINALRELQPLGQKAGGASYSLLLTVFAGIELLGTLVSVNKFNRYEGSDRFIEFWMCLYPKLEPSVGKNLYEYVRHGLAHLYVPKANIEVVKGNPEYHLTNTPEGVMRIDAAQLAEDLMNAYKNNVKTKVDAEDELADRMSARLNEITGNYKNNASKATTVYNLPVNNEPLGPSITPSGTPIYQTPTTLPNPSAVNEQTKLP